MTNPIHYNVTKSN